MSSKTKFTPGPWEVSASHNYIQTSWSSYGEIITIAQAFEIHDDRLANARLIAAAPALYESAHKAFGALIQLLKTQDLYGHHLRDFIQLDINQTIKQLDTALAKARGEA